MTFVGKILVLLNLGMSFVFMAFAVVVYTTRVDLQAALKSQKAAVAKANSERDGAISEKNDIQKKMSELNVESDKVKKKSLADLKDRDRQIDELKSDLRRSREETSTNLAQMQNASTEQQQRRQEVDTLRSDRDGLLKKNATLVTDNTTLQDQLAQANNDLDALNATNQRMVEKLRQLEGFIIRVRGVMPDNEELEAGADSPPPPDVEGVVTKVADGNFIQLSIGEDDGIRKGQTLQVWRTKPEPKYLGQIKIFSTEATTSVAKPLPGNAGMIQASDRVGPRVLSKK